jgi:hypothetical protein
MVTLLTCIWVAPELSITWGTKYLDWGFLWISSASSGRCQDSTSNYAMTSSFHILSYSLFTNVLPFKTIYIYFYCQCHYMKCKNKVEGGPESEEERSPPKLCLSVTHWTDRAAWVDTISWRTNQFSHHHISALLACTILQTLGGLAVWLRGQICDTQPCCRWKERPKPFWNLIDIRPSLNMLAVENSIVMTAVLFPDDICKPTLCYLWQEM